MKIHLTNPYSAGFSLIELLVVIAIIGTVSGAMMFNYNINKKRSDINAAAEEIADTLRRAQTSALSGEHYQGSTPDQYRVYFKKDSASYIRCAASAQTGGATCTDIVETLDLTGGITISEIVLSSSDITTVPTGISYSDGQVVFSVPFAEVTFYRNASLATSSQKLFNIVLYDPNINFYKIITVDKISGDIKIK